MSPELHFWMSCNSSKRNLLLLPLTGRLLALSYLSRFVVVDAFASPVTFGNYIKLNATIGK